MERGVGQDNGEARRIVGGDGCILGARGTASAPSGAVAGQEVPTQARCWAPLEAGAAGVRGHRVRASYRLPMEGLAQGALWQRQRHPQAGTVQAIEAHLTGGASAPLTGQSPASLPGGKGTRPNMKLLHQGNGRGK